MTESVARKIKALFNLAKDNANAEEADAAMKLAARLMLEYNIKESDLKEKSKVGEGPQHESEDDRWHMLTANAVAMLYNCRAVWYRDRLSFVGRKNNTDACDATYPWITSQIEALYKQNLTPGLSKQARALYRREFKIACALRVGNRIGDIMKTIKTEGTQTSTALVVLKKSEELLAEVEQFFESHKVRVVKPRPPKFTSDAAGDGYKAGAEVKIQKEIE